jgi:hypothetical protein
LSSRRRNVAAVAGAAALVAAATLAASAIASDPATTHTLHVSSSTTSYPAGWRLTSPPGPAGIITYELSSTGAKANGVGIPPAGTIAITIGVLSVSWVTTHPLLSGVPPDRAAASQSALQLLPHVIGTPVPSPSDWITTAAHSTVLDGVSAAAIVYRYRYAGVGNVQSDVLARHGHEIVYAELDTEPSLRSKGTAALATITTHWHWK